FSAEQISRATQFEIEGSDLKSGAEVGELLERGQPPPGNRRQLNFRGQKQICVSAPVRAAHSSAQLIQLRQTQPIGAIDENRVAERDVEAVLDDRGRDQNVGFVMHE